MPITESDCLHIRKEASSFLLLRSSTHFHLIRIDSNLSESKTARLLRLYPCTSAQLCSLGVHFSAFKTANLRGVAASGYQTGDILELWVGSDVRTYQLDSDYSEEFIRAFFKDYIVTQRDAADRFPAKLTTPRKAAWIINIISLVCVAAFLFVARPYKLWSVLCILCQLTALVLKLVFPVSFTLVGTNRHSSSNGKGPLLPAYFASAFGLGIRTLTDFTFQDHSATSFLLISLSVSAGIAIFLCSVSIRQRIRVRNICVESIAAIILAVALGFGSIGQLNYLLDFDHGKEYVAEAVNKESSLGVKATSYSCTVQLPNGEYIDLNLSATLYDTIDIGDRVIVTQHNGAFNIPFSTVKLIPDI